MKASRVIYGFGKKVEAEGGIDAKREVAQEIRDALDEGVFDHLHPPLRRRLRIIADTLKESADDLHRTLGWLATLQALTELVEKNLPEEEDNDVD